MRGFRMPKTVESVKNVIGSMLFSHYEKVEKSMPKWLPKSMKNCQKIDLEPTWGDWFSDCWCFGFIALDFLDLDHSLRIKKSKIRALQALRNPKYLSWPKISIFGRKMEVVKHFSWFFLFLFFGLFFLYKSTKRANFDATILDTGSRFFDSVKSSWTTISQIMTYYK